jgi:prepilin-type N-terminal cleavage/methylation domain-containing protein
MAPPFDAPRSPRSPRGFTLIEIVVVLFILGVVIAMAAAMTTALTASQRLSTTAIKMATIDAAIVQFVMQQKRLPCPADITLAANNANYGKEDPARDPVTGCTTEQNGVVPWISLGLAQNDVTDGWGRIFTYRVQPVLAANNGMDMSWCDPAGNAAPVTVANQAKDTCNSACSGSSVPPFQNCTPPSKFLAAPTVGNRGIAVESVGGAALMTPPTTGAAYVVISHGETGGHGFLFSGQQTPDDLDGAREKLNHPDLVFAPPYIDDSISESPHFDDIVSRPSVLAVVNKAGLGPRAHP